MRDFKSAMVEDLFQSVSFLLVMPDSSRALLSAVNSVGNRFSETMEHVLESTKEEDMEDVRKAVTSTLTPALFLLLVLQNLFDDEGEYRQPKEVLMGMMQDILDIRGEESPPEGCH